MDAGRCLGGEAVGQRDCSVQGVPLHIQTGRKGVCAGVQAVAVGNFACCCLCPSTLHPSVRPGPGVLFVPSRQLPPPAAKAARIACQISQAKAREGRPLTNALSQMSCACPPETHCLTSRGIKSVGRHVFRETETRYYACINAGWMEGRRRLIDIRH